MGSSAYITDGTYGISLEYSEYNKPAYKVEFHKYPQIAIFDGTMAQLANRLTAGPEDGIKRADLPAIILGFLFDVRPDAEAEVDMDDAKEWLARQGYGSPQAPKNVLEPAGVGNKYPGEEW